MPRPSISGGLLEQASYQIFGANVRLLAQKYGCVQCSSVESERVFSIAGITISERRTRLLPNNLNNLMIIHRNYEAHIMQGDSLFGPKHTAFVASIDRESDTFDSAGSVLLQDNQTQPESAQEAMESILLSTSDEIFIDETKLI